MNKRSRRLTLGLVVASLALVAGIGFWFVRARPARSLAGVALRRSIAVLGFSNTSGRPEAAWYSTALAEMLTVELGSGDGLRSVPGESVARARAELALPESLMLPREALARARQLLGADLLLLGSYALSQTADGNRLHLDVHLQDQAGDEVAGFSDEASEAELIELVGRVAARVRQSLGLPAAAAAAHATRATAPPSVEATRLYAEGLARLRLFEPLAARALLERAVAADPESPLAHSALSSALSMLGYDAQAREEAKRAFDLATTLPAPQRLLVEGRYRDAARERDKAVDIYRTLFASSPDDIGYGLLLAEAQTGAGKGKDALATLESLRGLGSGSPEDPRIDLDEAAAAMALSDLVRARDSAARSADKAAALGARLLEARARAQQALALWQQGEHAQAVAVSQQARAIYAAVGDNLGVAKSLNLTGLVLSDQGELARAKAVFQQALVVNRQLGSMSSVSAVLNNLATVLELEGDLAAATKNYQDALVIARELGDKRAVAGRLINIGQALHGQGDLPGAARALTEALSIAREIGARRQVWIGLAVQAAIHRQRVNLAAAKANFDEAGTIVQEIGDRSGSASVAYGLADLSLARGDIPAAQAKFAEALSLYDELGQKGDAAGARLAQAELALEEGHPAEGENLARSAAEEYVKEKRADDEVLANVVLSRARLEQSHLSQAREASERAIALGGKSQALETRLRVAIAAAQVRAASGQAEDAVRSLQAALAEAREAGFFATQLDVALALGEIELAAHPEAGRARLQALVRQADAKGFGLVARRAARAVGKPAS